MKPKNLFFGIHTKNYTQKGSFLHLKSILKTKKTSQHTNVTFVHQAHRKLDLCGFYHQFNTYYFFSQVREHGKPFSKIAFNYCG